MLLEIKKECYLLNCKEVSRFFNRKYMENSFLSTKKAPVKTGTVFIDYKLNIIMPFQAATRVKALFLPL